MKRKRTKPKVVPLFFFVGAVAPREKQTAVWLVSNGEAYALVIASHFFDARQFALPRLQGAQRDKTRALEPSHLKLYRTDLDPREHPLALSPRVWTLKAITRNIDRCRAETGSTP